MEWLGICSKSILRWRFIWPSASATDRGPEVSRCRTGSGDGLSAGRVSGGQFLSCSGVGHGQVDPLSPVPFRNWLLRKSKVLPQHEGRRLALGCAGCLHVVCRPDDGVCGARLLKLDLGFAAGLLSGSLTESPVRRARRFVVWAYQIRKQLLISHIAVADAVCCIFGDRRPDLVLQQHGAKAAGREPARGVQED